MVPQLCGTRSVKTLLNLLFLGLSLLHSRLEWRQSADYAIRYKLRMMGVQVDSPTYTFSDNLAVIRNASQPESTIKKKHNYVCYHAVRKSGAMGEIVCIHEASISNPAGIATKAANQWPWVKLCAPVRPVSAILQTLLPKPCPVMPNKTYL